MSIPVRWLTPHGELIPADFDAANLDEVARHEPDGVYTITRTYHSNKAVMLAAHMDRLEQSAQLESMPFDLDRRWLQQGLNRLINQAGFEESRFRITIPRHAPDTALLAVEPLRPIPESVRNSGVPVATLCIDRSNPQAKSNRWIQKRDQARGTLPEWAFEGLVCTADGEILEGFSSNFYGVIARRLHTAQDVVLSGIARQILLAVAKGVLEVTHVPIKREELDSLDEAMLTSSSRGVLPIVKIDGCIIGSGKPGPITLELWQRYQRWVEEHLEEI